MIIGGGMSWSFYIPTAIEELAVMWVAQTEENRH